MKAHNTHPGFRLVANEDGSVIIIALLMVILLSIVVIAGTRTSAIEVMIAANKKAGERVFYLAESMASQAGRVLENQKDADPSVLKDPLGWDAGGLVKENQVRNTAGNVIDVTATEGWEGGAVYDWVPTATVPVQTWPNMAAWGDADGDGVSDNPRAATDAFEYLIVDKGIATDGSLNSSNSSQLRQYNIRGRVQNGSVNEEVAMGYRIRVSN